MISGYSDGKISGNGMISFNAPSGSGGGGGGGNAYDDASLLMHLDATSSSNFTFSSGNIISRWNDLLGNYNFTSIGGNGTNRPYVTYDSANKRVFIDGTGGFPGYQANTGNPTNSCAILQCLLTSSIPLTNGGTFYCVIQEQAGSTWGNGPFTFDNNGNANGNLYGYLDAKTMYISTLGNSRPGPITITPPNGSQSFYNKAIYKVTVTNANVFTYQYITSLNNVSQTYSGGTRGIANGMLIGAGGVYNSTNNTFQYNSFMGYFYEVLLYNTVLTTTQQTAIENYLINKWSL